jgi:hypothetical protein
MRCVDRDSRTGDEIIESRGTMLQVLRAVFGTDRLFTAMQRFLPVIGLLTP